MNEIEIQKEHDARYAKGMICRLPKLNILCRSISNKCVMNPVNAPPRINNQLSMIYLWSFIWKEGRTLYSSNLIRFFGYRKFYEEQSRNKLKRYIFSPVNVNNSYAEMHCQRIKYELLHLYEQKPDKISTYKLCENA